MALPSKNIISVKDLKKKLDCGEKIQIIDIRNIEDFDIYHLKNAICIPRSEIPDNIHKIARDIPVLIYCKYGLKSPKIIEYLESEKGFTNLFSLNEGLYEWVKEIDQSILDVL